MSVTEFQKMQEAISSVAAASRVMHAADTSDNVTFKQEGDEITAIAPIGMAWNNGDHGLTVNVNNAAEVAEALRVLEAGTVECREADGCDVCDYGATEAAAEFSVWVSTFGLYSNGYLIGYWCPANEAPETVEEFLTGLQERGQKLPGNVAAVVGEELHCFDTENAPVRGELSPMEARAIAEVLDNADEDKLPALIATLRDQNANSAADVERIAAEFEDKFAGYFESLEDYFADYLEECGTFRSMPEELIWYFDFAAYARDNCDATLLQDANGYSFVIRD